MLIGMDISKWNDGIDVNAGEFTIMKISEGQTYRDPKANDFRRKFDGRQLLGAYHFLRADIKGNHPYKEAENFVNGLLEYDLLYKSLLVCDYEAGSLGHEAYLLQFLEGVKIMTGVKPIVYTGSSATKGLPNIAKAGYELWIAHYNVKSPKIYNWKSALAWQFTSKPFDVDIFNGNENDWYLRTIKQ